MPTPRRHVQSAHHQVDIRVSALQELGLVELLEGLLTPEYVRDLNSAEASVARLGERLLVGPSALEDPARVHSQLLHRRSACGPGQDLVIDLDA